MRIPKPKVGGSTPLGTAKQVKLDSETKNLSSLQGSLSPYASVDEIPGQTLDARSPTQAK
jgi:hypothetical protein